MRLRVPHSFTPRLYQEPLYDCLADGYKRGVAIWHRRAGKDKTLFNLVVKEAVKAPGVYYYFFPTYSQGKKILWDGIDPRTGMKFLDHIPPEIMEKKSDTEMKITLNNRSIIQIVGTDNFDSIMGTNPRGCVFSEFSLQDPRAWDYTRPILRENGGWALFVYTPRGKNHGWEMFRMAQAHDDWFTSLLTVRETMREDGSPVITEADIGKDRAEGMSDELIEQEYYCSFEGYVQGAYYAKQLKTARAEGRITSVPHAAGHEVYTFWDLGVDDSTSIWFTQSIGREFRMIDYYEATGEGLAHYAKVLKERGYTYGDHYMPHDVEVRELSTGVSRKETAENLGISPVLVVQRARDTQAVLAGIEAVRNIMSQCWFDEKKCSRGLSALEGYQAEYDEEKKKLADHPLHNWCSHGADAFRTFAVGYRPKANNKAIIDALTRPIMRGW